MIKASNITRYYGDFLAVDDVSFEIKKGEIVGLLGHNGAGKTTIMKMLTGFLETSGGEINIGDYNIEHSSMEIQNMIGYLPEASPLYPEMTVMQYLDYVCNLRGVSFDKRKSAIKEAIQKVKLEEKAFNPLQTLSKGLKQRVGLAQAIIHKPKILILDEPTSGLDPSQIEEVRTLIKDLSKTSTIILSTHILQEVEAICDRVIIILRGKVAADSNLSELRASNRISVSVDRKESEVNSVFNSIEGVSAVKFIGNGGPASEYSLELEESAENVAPKVAEIVIQKGWKLFALQKERQNLESIFRKINKG